MIQKGCRHAELEIWQLRQGLIRVIAKNEPSKVFIGEPLSSTADVCSALRNSQDVWAYLFTGSLVLSPGKQEQSKRSRLTEYSLHSRQNEVGTMRCIGPHVKCFHAQDVKIPLPDALIVFLLGTCPICLNDPFPSPVPLPEIPQSSASADCEADFAVVIGGACRNVTETEADNFILGYTACSAGSSRALQFRDSQWSFAKGFDGACPIGKSNSRFPGSYERRNLCGCLVCKFKGSRSSQPYLNIPHSQGATRRDNSPEVTGR
ncbi:uncharacterized protein SETTUDRAFT_91664 [Exserohilum turcica Et28A]|uniref:Fumarylacetoacetase-like C-terminal domain-containing protein n=1 Tax=Exserohilum turcicum (strain 28A) TaxID=671987 RepID=R0IHY4_EXST2|nr:uncharacterized protein SETTUDRAFT_91664 [Exserohilum turcica Et28A]EOA84800.1 hypothetical protein SETTUDRAFT_91664 [Exserohilum turcica Et28A]